MSVLSWHLLLPLGTLLAELAGVLGAACFQDHYSRDLGIPVDAAHAAAPAGASGQQSGGCQQSQLGLCRCGVCDACRCDVCGEIGCTFSPVAAGPLGKLQSLLPLLLEALSCGGP